MAYNPFNIFRRNQRSIFAVLTVVIMFMFVLSSGLAGSADFFAWFPEWLGSRKKGDVLCTIDGDKVYLRELEGPGGLRFQRMVANKFMVLAGMEASQNLQKQVFDLQAQATPQTMQQLRMAAAMEQFQPGGFDRMSQVVLDDPKSKQADKETVRAMRTAMELSQGQQIFARTGTYFGTVPNRNNRDLVDFLLWRKKAEQLGIRYSEDDVKKLIEREFLGEFKTDVRVRDTLQSEYRERFSLSACMKALAAEFEVRAAQTALLGSTNGRPDQTLSAAPIFTAPYELYEFYRDKTSPTTYQVLAVPDALFMGRVQGTPTEDELQRLFSEWKDAEPDPAKETPGFKDPRKVKVEWVSVTGEEPYYQKQAADWVRLTEQLAKSEVRGLVVPVPGMGAGAWAAMVAAPGAMREPLVQSQYKSTVLDRHEVKLRFNWDGTSRFVTTGDILDTSVVRAQNLAAAAGGGAGLAAGLGNALLPADLLIGGTISAEQRARVRACLPLMLGAVPGPGMFATAVGGEAAFRKNLPEPLSIEAYKPELLKTLTEQKARELAVADLKKLKAEVDKLTENGKKRDKSEARAYVADFIKARGIKAGGTAELQSEWTIADDPGMAPLKAVLDKIGAGAHGNMPVPFGSRFFHTTNPRTGAKEPATGTYQPEFYPERAAEMSAGVFGKPDPVFLAWRTDEQPARGVSFSTARPRVVEAWKRIRARDLAKAEAERLANELRAKPASSEAFIEQTMTDMQGRLQAKAADPKVRDKVRLFKVKNVAPFAISDGPTPTVQPFQVAPSENVPYPTPDMTKVLLDERTKPVNTVVVLPDQPKDTFYVFDLANRTERSEAEFRAQMYDRLGTSQVKQQIAMAYRMESGRKAHESVLAMLKKEFNYVETEEQKKRLDDNRRGSEE
jgi:hypothetical protein